MPAHNAHREQFHSSVGIKSVYQTAKTCPLDHVFVTSPSWYEKIWKLCVRWMENSMTSTIMRAAGGENGNWFRLEILGIFLTRSIQKFSIWKYQSCKPQATNPIPIKKKSNDNSNHNYHPAISWNWISLQHTTDKWFATAALFLTSLPNLHKEINILKE